jgi:hypothetical protein
MLYDAINCLVHFGTVVAGIVALLFLVFAFQTATEIITKTKQAYQTNSPIYFSFQTTIVRFILSDVTHMITGLVQCGTFTTGVFTLLLLLPPKPLGYFYLGSIFLVVTLQTATEIITKHPSHDETNPLISYSLQTSIVLSIPYNVADVIAGLVHGVTFAAGALAISAILPKPLGYFYLGGTFLAVTLQIARNLVIEYARVCRERGIATA